MSEFEEPGEWWVASDGKWYPRELHPSVLNPSVPAPPAADPSPQKPPRARRGGNRARLLVVAVVLVGLTAGIVAAAGTAGSGKATPPAQGSVPTPAGHGSTASTAPTAAAGSDAGAQAASAPSSGSSIAPEGAVASGATAPQANATDVATGPPIADVAATQCVIDPTRAGFAIVNGTVVNHDTQTDDYTIIVYIDDGARTVGSAFVTDPAVAVGATSPWSVQGAVEAGTGGPLTCQVASVHRAPS